jgi:heme o synthase
VSDTSIGAQPAAEAAGSVSAAVIDFTRLLKPRVMSLVVFTGFAGLYLAPGSLHPVLEVIAILCIAVGAGASGAINMWYDRDIDAVMSRTRERPIPAGQVGADEALTFGVVLACGSVMVMGLAVNWLSAGLLAMTIAFYVFVYTMWLKRRTPQNIVIGGAAGAFPPMIGWAAVSGTVTVDSVVLFAIIFFWTPPHFWALSLYRSGDYEAAGVPMLPVVAGRRETQKQILLYSLLLAPLGLAPTVIGTVGLFYGITAAILGAAFVYGAWRVWRDASDRNCKQLFGYSICYLFLIFLALVVDRAVGMPSIAWIGS